MLARLLPLLLIAAAAGAEDVFNDRVAHLEPFPREVGRGRTIVVEGFVKGGFTTPELILIAPNGKTYLNEDNKIGPEQFTFKVRFGEGIGPYRLEVIVRKHDSYQSAMRVTVYHGVKKPPVEEQLPPPTGAPTPVLVHPRLVEKRFQRRLNEFRDTIGLDPAAWNEAVAARAREHAERMARAERRLHRFGKLGGVDDMLARDGAGPGGLSGPNDPWTQVSSVRPFDRPAPRTPGPRTFNHVVVFVLADSSLERMFEAYFVREAAFRICAADPNLVEVAVGCARTPPRNPKGPPPPLVYYCVCFVQVNDIRLIRAQDKAYDRLRETAEAGLDPALLRTLGAWGRPEASGFLARAIADPRPEISAAAFDGLLLLDEDRARAELQRAGERARALVEKGRYAEGTALLRPFEGSIHDGGVPRAIHRFRLEASGDARREIKGIRGLPREERIRALENLLARCEGLPSADQVRRELEKAKTDG